MAMFQAPQVVAQTTHDQLLDLFARVVKELEFIVNGAIDSKNVREIGGYNVNKTELQSRDGAVGMSSARTEEDDLRIWAGDPDRAKAAFKVYESGLVMLSRFILSSLDGKYSVTIDEYGGAPSLNFILEGEVKARINLLLGFEIISLGSMRIATSAGNISLAPSGQIEVASWKKILNNETGQTLYTDLADLSDRIEALENAGSGGTTP
ncbi:hypothetical protein [Paenibacillus polymyxa]|uniref:hypothetical protein n=1 Tax=Paenibacillus polymyxa TaxID=1406 RepID=UPI0023798406|nr:hypothetical protein [Paenibacillus polymyxa]WDM22654.1 hypothetical protein J4I02_03265 [Paenibacillus polymyxa]